MPIVAAQSRDLVFVPFIILADVHRCCSEPRSLCLHPSGRAGRTPQPVMPCTRCLACRSEEHTSELQSRQYLVCRLLLEKKKKKEKNDHTQIAHNTNTP